MTTVWRFHFLLVCLCLAVASINAQSLPPKENIPPDLDADLRQEIEGLYSDEAVKRANCASKLGSMGERAAAAIPYLDGLLGDGERATTGDLMKITASISWYAANALGRIGPASTDTLIAFLEDLSKDKNLRSNAAWGLAQSGDPRAVPALLSAAKDSHDGLRAEAAHALRSICDPATLETLADLIQDKNSSVRFYAVQGLGCMKDARAAVPAIMALGDADPDVQGQARGALQELGSLAVDSLIAALADPNPVIKREAEQLLRTITKKKFGMNQQKWRDWWDKNRR